MPVGQVIAVVKKPVGTGFGQPAGLFPNRRQVDAAAVVDDFKAVIVNAAETVLTVKKTAAGVGKAYFAFDFDFVETAFAAAVAKQFPFGRGHLF